MTETRTGTSKIKVIITGMDDMEAKAKRLHDLIREAKSLANDLTSHEVEWSIT